ncbi:hypothetical protein WJX77_004836 [Trebouxia sp. C0004]
MFVRILSMACFAKLYIDDIKARADRTGETAPESSRVLTAVLESMDERLHTIELASEPLPNPELGCLMPASCDIPYKCLTTALKDMQASQAS